MDIPSYLLGKKASGGGGSNLRYVVVDELPTVGENNIIYLVPKSTSGTNNYYDEYMYINSAWELIGDTVVDLTDYVKNTDYATSNKGGVIKVGNGNAISNAGVLHPLKYTYEQYLQNMTDNFYIGKGTLENVIAGKGLQIQLSTMPTASADNLGKIVQYTGTTDSTYTNGYFYKCVSDGASTPTYSWEEVEVQAGGGGASYTAGTNIEITNQNVINNTIPYKESSNGRILIGSNTTDASALADCLAIGKNTKLNTGSRGSIIIGNFAESNEFVGNVLATFGIAIGLGAKNTKSKQAIFGGRYGEIDEMAIYTTNGIKVMATEEFVQNYLTTLSTYDASKTQVLKNVNGTLTWVDEA